MKKLNQEIWEKWIEDYTKRTGKKPEINAVHVDLSNFTFKRSFEAGQKNPLKKDSAKSDVIEEEILEMHRNYGITESTETDEERKIIDDSIKKIFNKFNIKQFGFFRDLWWFRYVIITAIRQAKAEQTKEILEALTKIIKYDTDLDKWVIISQKKFEEFKVKYDNVKWSRG